jgi:hypothetical protein
MARRFMLLCCCVEFAFLSLSGLFVLVQRNLVAEAASDSSIPDKKRILNFSLLHYVNVGLEGCDSCSREPFRRRGWFRATSSQYNRCCLHIGNA